MFDELTVGENLKLVPVPRKDARRRITQAMSEFPILGERWNQRAGTLSGGEAQMLSLARAQLLAPKLVLLDEPTANLAAGVIDSLQKVLRRWRDAGQSLLVIEHNLDFVLELCDRLYVIQRGETVFNGSAQDLLADGKRRLRNFFGLSDVDGATRSACLDT